MPDKSSIILISVPALLKVEPVEMDPIEGSCRFVGVWMMRYLLGDLRQGAMRALCHRRAPKPHPKGVAAKLSKCCWAQMTHTLVPQIRVGPGWLPWSSRLPDISIWHCGSQYRVALHGCLCFVILNHILVVDSSCESKDVRITVKHKLTTAMAPVNSLSLQ